MTKLIYTIKNGDTHMLLFDNGTRILDNMKDSPFELKWPVSVDLNISNYCTKGCSFCYAGNTKEGKHADLEAIKKILHPYMEVAININEGFPIDMKFVDFLEYCRDNHIVVNATVNQDDLYWNRTEEILQLQDYGLLNGIGISYTHQGRWDDHIHSKLKNVVWHVIAGLIDVKTLNWLKGKKQNILILGYKQKGRAKDTELPDMTELKAWIKDNINQLESVLCFDNMALEQLSVKELIDDKTWSECYQGDEGTISMYINGVDMTFSCNSFTDVIYPIDTYNIEEMFGIIKAVKTYKGGKL